MRFAFLGRTSDEDAQDPSLSIPRQLHSCEVVVKPLDDEVVAHYWEVESGRKCLESRGNSGGDWSDFNVPVPRDGGIKELIRDAATGRFDAVIVESIDRVSRMTADSTRVEQELERLGVALFAADEPMNTNATPILTRRVKQGIAEWYVRDLMEKSRRGMEESVRQGWHTGGRPPYGYTLEEHPHPNPSKAREGKQAPPRHRPGTRPGCPDDLRGLLRAPARPRGNLRQAQPRPLSAADPNRKDESALPHTWSRSVLNALLRNPKYTGFNVWGRNDKRPARPQIRPREEWVRSPTPTHPTIITRELFDMVEERVQRNADAAKAGRSRAAHRQPKPQARRLYPLRGRVRCGMCGHRM